MVVDRAGFMLFHPSFVENPDFDEPHLTILVKSSPPFYSKESNEKKQILSKGSSNNPTDKFFR